MTQRKLVLLVLVVTLLMAAVIGSYAMGRNDERNENSHCEVVPFHPEDVVCRMLIDGERCYVMYTAAEPSDMWCEDDEEVDPKDLVPNGFPSSLTEADGIFGSSVPAQVPATNP